MKAINEEYQTLLKSGRLNFGTSSQEIEAELMEVIQQLTVLKGLTVEICGRWIWVTGNTFPLKKRLREIGCLWASKKKAWYWRSKKEKKRRTRTISLDKIRQIHGSQVIKSSKIEAIA